MSTKPPPSENRRQLNASIARLQSALAKVERTDQRRAVKTGRSNALYRHVVETIDGLAEAIRGES